MDRIVNESLRKAIIPNQNISLSEYDLTNLSHVFTLNENFYANLSSFVNFNVSKKI